MCASEMLNERGPEGVSLRGAARMADVSQTAPYRHFKNKEALLAAVSEAGFLALTELARRAQAAHQNAPLKALEASAKAYVRFAIQNHSQYRLMFGTAVRGSRHPGLREAAMAAMSNIVDSIIACQQSNHLRQGDPKDQAVVMWSLVHGLTSSLIDEQFPIEARSPEAIDRITGYAMACLIEGMGSRSQN